MSSRTVRSRLAWCAGATVMCLLALVSSPAAAQGPSAVPADVLGDSLRASLPLSVQFPIGSFQPFALAATRSPEVEAREQAFRASTVRPETERPLVPEMDVGAGLAWRLLGGLELFGEYRLLHLRRDQDEPLFRAGLSIPLR